MDSDSANRVNEQPNSGATFRNRMDEESDELGPPLEGRITFFHDEAGNSRTIDVATTALPDRIT